jgi:hypothetical protein
VDEAAEGLRAKGITVVGAVCHVSNAEHRKHLVDTAVKVRSLHWLVIPCDSSVVLVLVQHCQIRCFGVAMSGTPGLQWNLGAG